MAKSRLTFNHYKYNVTLNGEGRLGFKQEKLIEHFFLLSDNGTHKGIQIQIIGPCDPNDQEARENLDFPSEYFASRRFKSKTRIKILNKWMLITELLN